VAEGIETAEQAARMLELGCAYGQGYHFARPVPGADVVAGAFGRLADGSTETDPRHPEPTRFRAPLGGFARRRPTTRTDAIPA
jgi:predicted signal transduction protein with EAL and GGDEF domain